MAYELIKARIPFRQVYTLLPRGRERFYDWFRGEVELKIDVVDPVSAPVAYEVRLGSDMAPRALSYQIRSYRISFGGRWEGTTPSSFTVKRTGPPWKRDGLSSTWRCSILPAVRTTGPGRWIHFRIGLRTSNTN